MRISLTKKIIDGLVVQLGNSLQLNHVQAALSEFAFRQEASRLAKPFRNFALTQAGLMPRFNQAFKERPINSLIRCITFVHSPRVRES